MTDTTLDDIVDVVEAHRQKYSAPSAPYIVAALTSIITGLWDHETRSRLAEQPTLDGMTGARWLALQKVVKVEARSQEPVDIDTFISVRVQQLRLACDGPCGRRTVDVDLMTVNHVLMGAWRVRNAGAYTDIASGFVKITDWWDVVDVLVSADWWPTGE